MIKSDEYHNSIKKKTGWRSPVRWILTALFSLFVIALIFAANQFRNIPLKVSEETTLYTSPLKENGDVDYLAVFEKMHYSDDLATEKNGFRLVVDNVDLSEELNGRNLIHVRKRLGLAPSSARPRLGYTDPHQFIDKYYRSASYDESLVRKLAEKHEILATRLMGASRKLDSSDVDEIIISRSHHPWTAKELPMMQKWVEQSSPALDLVADAVRKPCFEFPLSTLDTDDSDEQLLVGIIVYTHAFRSFARGYMARANFYLGTGEVRKAIDDVISCKRLGRHIRNSGTSLVERLVGVAIEGISDSIEIVNTQADKTSEQDLKYFVSQLQDIPPLKSFDSAIFFEKLAWLDIMQWTSRNPNKESEWLFYEEEFASLKSLGIDWNIAAKSFNEYFDQYWSTGVWDETGLSDITWRHYISRAARSRKMGRWFALFTVGGAMNEAERRTKCSQNLKRITLAMLVYEKEKGTLPPAFTVDENEKPLHSWRVLLLPYLGEQKLFNQIRLDEPWDSKHNSQLVLKCPSVFACPSCEDCKSGHTSYSVIVGKDVAFEDSKGKSLSSFGPYSDDLILVAERFDPINWMDPTNELTVAEAETGINLNDPHHSSGLPSVKTGVGSSHPAGSQFGFRNGSVNFESETIDPTMFKNKLRGINRSLSEY